MQPQSLLAPSSTVLGAPDALDSALQALEGTMDLEADALARCQAHATVAACLMDRTDVSQAEWHWQQALRLARVDSQTDVILDILCALGRTAFGNAQAAERVGDHALARVALNRARDYCFEGVQELHAVQNRELEAAALHRIAAILADCGDVEDADALRDRARRVALSPEEAARILHGCPRVSAFGTFA